MFYDSSEDEEEGDLWPFYSVGGPHDVLVPRGEAIREIGALLGRAGHGRAAFSFGGRAFMLPDLPGLNVKDVGHVSLPLLKRDTEELIEKGVGLGEKTWMVAGDQVEMKNCRWEEGMQTLTKLSAEKLGFKGVALELKMSRLLLFGEGGGMKKQRDVEETGRVIGTIVVLLPSKHSGGDLVVYEEGTKDKARYELGKCWVKQLLYRIMRYTLLVLVGRWRL
ncbi:hypothetical protein PF010_g17871 [Phytophthora fragariae]|nr:hypothetical protein PF003_g4972 [Phytophthora fragariae]KAE8932609.1 hypothetical protein PF009_g17364 [Phytophthora fragariae]KAE9092258.1 hypothetical protein PF010_g17871 [Phytophthora fragariae]KAE9098363.1 hypothetical protein PF007_g16294 [Phytophthora fragariae]KAE9123434.1 hypothetical protein PF006_g17432 [Phytophthora fragariae]